LNRQLHRVVGGRFARQHRIVATPFRDGVLGGEIDPGMPRRSERALGRVLVHQIPLVGQVVGAELEERQGRRLVPRRVDRARRQRAVTRPAVAVGVAGE